MNPHALFYYPFASFGYTQAPLLKAAALYFDKLYILDPEKASGGTIGLGETANEVALLEDEGILVRVAPEEVLHKYEEAITAAIRADVEDSEFLKLCEASGRAQRWTVALAKVPKEIRSDPRFQPLDRSMQRLMGDLPRSVAPDIARYSETYAEVTRPLFSAEFVYDERRPGLRQQIVEYRYADYPLPLGEAIMVNHALFAGLLRTGATPLTDDPFHNQVLSLKIERARGIPQVRQILEDRVRLRRLKADELAVAALTDIDLATIPPEVSLQDILEYRDKHESELQRARDRLGWLAREIREAPWSKEFADELEYNTIPRIHRELEESKRARDSWLKSGRGRRALKAAGLAVGAAASTISLVLAPTPLLPVAVVTGALGLLGGTVIPGTELALDWKQGKKEVEGNGLHYLLRIK